MDLGKDLIDKMSTEEFEAEKYHDEYRERFLAMIDHKLKGEEVAVLIAALKQSLEPSAPRAERAAEKVRTFARREKTPKQRKA
jgi:DNA end-binding protein Ku